MPAPTATGPFPTTKQLQGKPVRLHCRSQWFRGTVALTERDEEGAFATVLLKLPGRPPKRPFALGELALVETMGASWTGTVANALQIDEVLLCNHVFVSVPDGGDCRGFPYGDFLTIYPSKSTPSQFSFALNRPFDEMKLKVALVGFGALGMHLVQALLNNKHVDLIAIRIDSPTSDMLRAWKSSAISLKIEDDRTILFKRQATEEDEVLVRIVRGSYTPWDGLSVDYVVDTLNILTEDKHVIHSMAYEGEDKATAYSLVDDDKGNCPRVTATMQVNFKYMKIVVRSDDVLKSVMANIPEWDPEGESARICFLSGDNPTERICSPFTEESDNIVDARLSFLLRIFIDVIRHVPISGCQLEI